MRFQHSLLPRYLFPSCFPCPFSLPPCPTAPLSPPALPYSLPFTLYLFSISPHRFFLNWRNTQQKLTWISSERYIHSTHASHLSYTCNIAFSSCALYCLQPRRFSSCKLCQHITIRPPHSLYFVYPVFVPFSPQFMSLLCLRRRCVR